jgi:hypothetical protein
VTLEQAQVDYIDKAVAFHDHMASVGAPILFHEYIRSPERQQELFDAGQTRAKAWESPHQYGLSADYSFDPHGYNVPDSWWEYADWVARQLGLETGLYFNDANHLQDPGWTRWKRGFFGRLFS